MCKLNDTLKYDTLLRGTCTVHFATIEYIQGTASHTRVSPRESPLTPQALLLDPNARVRLTG